MFLAQRYAPGGRKAGINAGIKTLAFPTPYSPLTETGEEGGVALIDLPDLEGAALVRGGDERDVSRLCRWGGRVIERGECQDSDGTPWPYVLVRLGRRRVLVVLGTAPCNDGAA